MLLAARCPICNRTVSAACAECWESVEPAPPGCAAPAAVAYAGAGRRLLLGLKYGNGRTLAVPLARRLTPLLTGRSVDMVTWAPTSERRRRKRGFDQAELIARAVARELGVPCRNMLRRVGRSSTQTGRSRLDRTMGAPRFVARRVWGPVRVVVVDDVVTTGATLRAAERALRRGGCAEVLVVAAAATP